MTRQWAFDRAEFLEIVDFQIGKPVIGFERVEAVFAMTCIVDEIEQLKPFRFALLGLMEHQRVRGRHQLGKCRGTAVVARRPAVHRIHVH